MAKYCMVFGSDDEKSLFELGIWKACLDSNIQPEAIAGAAFGAINVALVAQGSFEMAVRFWSRAIDSKIFSDFYDLRRKYSDNLATPGNKEILKLIKRISKDNEPVLTQLDSLLEAHIDENQVRASAIKAFIPTISFSDFTAIVLSIDDIPRGQLIDAIKFSMLSYLFFYISTDEQGVNILDDASFKIVCPPNISTKVITANLLNVDTLLKLYPQSEFLIVENSEYLGLSYTHTFESMKRNIHIGLLDTLKTLDILKGQKYYIDLNASNTLYQWFEEHFCRPITPELDEKIGRLLNIYNTEIQSNILKGVERVAQKCRYQNDHIHLTALETTASLLYIERAKRYSPDALINEIILSVNSILRKNYHAIQDEENIFKAMSGHDELPSFTDDFSPAINMIYFLCAPTNSNIFMHFINSMTPEVIISIVTLIYLLIY
mgnify:CR=1 FL=1